MSGGNDMFTCGSTVSETLRNSAREGLVNIKLDQDYWMAVFELTQDQLSHITNGFTHANYEHPIYISYDAMRGTLEQGINWPTTVHTVASDSVLAVFREKTGLDLDLPTEAQWEYACRAGTATPFHDDVFKESYTTNDYNTSLMTLGRFILNGNALTSVGLYQPNTWGLYDMHGNAYEWCLNLKADDINPGNLDYLLNPVGPASTTPVDRMVRSGCFASTSKDCRSASRSPAPPRYSYGFRLVVPAAD